MPITLGSKNGLDSNDLNQAQALIQCPSFGYFNPLGATETISEKAVINNYSQGANVQAGSESISETASVIVI